MNAKETRAAFIAVQLISIVVGGAIGLWGATGLAPQVNAIVLGALAAVLVFSNVSLKAVNDGFNDQLQRLDGLDSQRQSTLMEYIEERRFEVHVGSLIAALACALCAAGASSEFVPGFHSVVSTTQQRWLFGAAFVASVASIPTFIRTLNYWRLLGRFARQISGLISEEERRTSILAALRVDTPEKTAGTLVSQR